MSKDVSLLDKMNNAFALITDGRDAEAALEFESALSIARERMVIRDISYQLSQCYVVIREYEKSVKSLIKAMQSCTRDEAEIIQELNSLLRAVYPKLKNKQTLTEILEDIISTDYVESPLYFKAAIRLAKIYIDEKKDAEALKLAENTLRTHGENTELLALKIKARNLVKDYKPALSEGLDYIRRFGFEGDVYIAVGGAYYFYKHPDKGFKYLREAYESIPAEHRAVRSLETQAFSLTTSILSGTLYHEECDKEFFKTLLKHRLEITGALEKNTVFNRDYGFFRRLRIGYLSADFTAHPVGIFISSVIQNRNTCHSDNICYSVTAPAYLNNNNPVSGYLKESSAAWHDLFGKTDDELEEFILGDKPDIMLELASLTEENKLDLYTRRLSPLQVSWIGFPVSTGVKAIDYVITDRYADPPGTAEEYYTEKLLYLPDTFLCHLHTYANVPGPLPYDKNGYITFGCFNNTAKITDKMFKNWDIILRRVPGSRLIIKSNTFRTEVILNMVKERAEGIGLDMDRVSFEISSYYSEYLDKYNEVDIMLDTYPFNGATTTFDAFMMGVPLVALIGETHASRVSLGMLKNVGLGDLVTTTDLDYIETACRLAADIGRLRELKRTLRDIKMNSKLSDVDSFRAEYEHAMRRIWIEYCKEHRIFPIYGSLSLAELSDSLVNGAFYIRKLIKDSGQAVSDIEIIDEYINLQRVFTRKLEGAWRDDPEKAKPLQTCRLISNAIYKLKNSGSKDMDDILLSNTRFIKHYLLN